MLPYLLAITGGYLIGSSAEKFADGGIVSKYKIFEGYDHYKGEPIYQVIGVDSDYEGEYYRQRKEAEQELFELEGKYEYGGRMSKDLRYRLAKATQYDKTYLDGVYIREEIDGVKVINWMDVSEKMEKQFLIEEDKTELEIPEDYDKIAKLVLLWAKKNDAHIHTFWNFSTAAEAFSKAKIDGVEEAKKLGKKVVILEYNS
jgi:hypothetical protein